MEYQGLRWSGVAATAGLLCRQISFFSDYEDDSLGEVCGRLVGLSFGFAERFPSPLSFDSSRRFRSIPVAAFVRFQSTERGDVDSWAAGPGSAAVGDVCWSILVLRDLIHR
uniref:Uncharacterized protein n=1 Tax=Setaria viridis TaxID=4556 RepID=A0A4U6T215_SETVI|nr:hypothetical protein SEVIR_9G053300v2 [Setaria viridis]